MEIKKADAFLPAGTPSALDALPDSAALARLVEEVRLDRVGALPSPTAYNRTYHRHNR